MYVSIIDKLADIPSDDWNALTHESAPFLKYEFLYALESTGCVSADTGWEPRHLVVHADGPLHGRLIGAVPLYLKTHSYGEYIFDWAWADAYARAGLNYYPKLVAAIPFTPVTGTRLLAVNTPAKNTIKECLIQAALSLAKNERVSSLHWLFTTEEETQILENYDHIRRSGYQFHWHNQGYQSFDEFLSVLSAEKRKKIKRERRYVREAGIEIDVVNGEAINPSHWDFFYKCYQSTIHLHGAIPYLTQAFFKEIGRRMSPNIVLILARHNREYIAAALNLRDRNSLYGRYWGSLREFHSLHFETCYYSAINYCIETGLSRFEAGAQGEYKLARGLLPTTTYSAHWLTHTQFRHAVADFLEREKNDVQYYINELSELSPFKKSY